ncbi:MAG: hypothetical protein ACRDQB_01725 [Thermocrispum sp.]
MARGPVLGTAKLNRAMLARQLLLDRAELPPNCCDSPPRITRTTSAGRRSGIY